MEAYILYSTVCLLVRKVWQCAPDGDSLWLLDGTMLAALPLVCLIDDVTYLHVEPPVLRL